MITVKKTLQGFGLVGFYLFFGQGLVFTLRSKFIIKITFIIMNLHQTIWFTLGTQNIYLPSRSMCLAGIIDKNRPKLSGLSA